MTHGHELKVGNVGGRGFLGMKGGKWDNCNSIINKIYLKNKDFQDQEVPGQETAELAYSSMDFG